MYWLSQQIVNNVSTITISIRRLNFLFCLQDNASVISEIQKGIGSSARTSFIISLLISIGERNGKFSNESNKSLM